MIDLYNYLDYREYLRDYYADQKKEKSFFSYRFIGLKVGMDPSYIIRVLQGTLHLSPAKVERFIKLLGLDESEADYFEALVLFCKAKNERQRKLYFEKLFTISTVKARHLDSNHYGFFQKWYYSAVWSILDCAPFQGDFGLLARQCEPPITVAQAKEALKLLEKLGMVEKDGAGFFRTRERNLTTGQKWHSYVIENYQREMVRLGGESISRAPKQDRDISTLTLSVNEKDLPEIREHVRQFRSSLIKLVNSLGGSGRVFQMNMQLFALSGLLEKKP